MIVDMKKITLLCMDEQKKTSLDALRELGVLHLEHINKPASSDLDSERATLDRASSAAGILHHHIEETETEPRPANIIAEETVEKAHELHEQLQNLTTLHEELYLESQTLETYGNVDPQLITELQSRTINIKFYTASDKDEIIPPDGAVFLQLSDSGSTRTFTLISSDEIDYDGTEVPAPEKKLSDVLDEIESLAKQIKTVEAELIALATSIKAVEDYVIRQEDSVKYTEARDGMGLTGKIAYLTGYCPCDKVEKVRKGATENGWGLVLDDPTLDDDVPTLIRYPKFVKPVKAVLEMLGITPGYREADISSIFLVFFSIFFAMLIGDAGYGFLFLGATLYLRSKNKSAPAYPFTLFTILSTCTIIWGVMTNNYFGIKPEFLPEFLRVLRVPWLTDGVIESRNHIMKLSFLVGASHLTIAHIWNSIVLYPNKKWIAQAGWIMLVWTMYLTACSMVLGDAFPKLGYGMLGVATALILLFMASPEEFKKEKIEHIMFPLTLVSCFVDVISYIRLFAVGMASLSVAQSFNDMAMRLDISKIWTVPIIALILLAGHGLNILLCALGILVHGVRLNTLEFSVHKELEWSGTKYNPFKKSKQSVINN